MKFSKISLYIAAVLSITGASCSDSYLDKEVDLTLQPEFVFSDFNMTRGVYASGSTLVECPCVKFSHFF